LAHPIAAVVEQHHHSVVDTVNLRLLYHAGDDFALLGGEWGQEGVDSRVVGTVGVRAVLDPRCIHSWALSHQRIDEFFVPVNTLHTPSHTKQNSTNHALTRIETASRLIGPTST